MANDKNTLAWDLFVELRKEILESQKIRAQIIGFKITFVSSVMAVAIASIDKIPTHLLIIPAFAAVFFDFLITSYSFSIKRTGYYIRTQLEPIWISSCLWQKETPLWEEYMTDPSNKQNLSFLGNLGITLLSSGVGIVGLYISQTDRFLLSWQAFVGLLLLFFLGLDVWSFYQPIRVFKTRKGNGSGVEQNKVSRTIG